MKRFFKITSLILVVCLVLPFAGCKEEGTQKQPINVPSLFQSILKQVQFSDTLESVGAAASLYFPDLPETAAVELYMGSGYFADEAALITLADTADMKAARASVDTHLQQIHDQFAHYIPEELDKIKDAYVWEHETYIIVCISNRVADAKLLVENAGNPNYQLPSAPTEPATQPSTPPVTEPTDPPTEPPTVPTEPPVTDPLPTDPEPTEPEPTEPEPTEPELPEDLKVNPVDKLRPDGYPMLESVTGKYHYMSGLLRVDNRAFEFWEYRDSVVSSYASLVNKVAADLAGTTTVYSLPIPTSYGIMVPDDILAIYPGYNDQGKGIESLLSKLSSDVIAANCYDNLMSHRNEYLYFRTDHHWNGLGAYYAYEAFCEAKGIQPYTMDQRTELKFGNFFGSLYSYSGKDANLRPADTVYAYKPYFSDTTMVYYDANGSLQSCPIVADVTYWGSGNKYLTFAGGDNPLSIFTNPNVTDGSVCIVVKESFGNALMPYLVDHYSTIYEIDYRYWKGDLVSYAKEVGATDLLFANNMNMITTNSLVASLYKIVK